MIPIGDDPPHSLNVIIEVPVGGEPVKYEFDKKSGAIFVDRILHTAMRYQANYGFIPHTLGEDGDPLDCLMMNRWPFMPGCVVRARPVAVLFLEDEAGGDEQLLAVPDVKTTPYYEGIGVGEDLPKITSTKSLTGHSQGATGVHEVIYSLLMLRDDFVGASANIENLDPGAEGFPIPRQRVDNAGLETVMSNSFGFGGTNAVLVFQRVDG